MDIYFSINLYHIVLLCVYISSYYVINGSLKSDNNNQLDDNSCDDINWLLLPHMFEHHIFEPHMFEPHLFEKPYVRITIFSKHHMFECLLCSNTT